MHADSRVSFFRRPNNIPGFNAFGGDVSDIFSWASPTGPNHPDEIKYVIGFLALVEGEENLVNTDVFANTQIGFKNSFHGLRGSNYVCTEAIFYPRAGTQFEDFSNHRDRVEAVALKIIDEYPQAVLLDARARVIGDNLHMPEFNLGSFLSRNPYQMPVDIRIRYL